MVLPQLEVAFVGRKLIQHDLLELIRRLQKQVDWGGYQECLNGAVYFGNVRMVDYLLDSGADIDAVVRGNGYGGLMDMTALMNAVYHNQQSMVEHLLARGANPRISVGGGRDALYWAKKLRKKKLINLLSNKTPAKRKTAKKKVIRKRASQTLKKDEQTGFRGGPDRSDNKAPKH